MSREDQVGLEDYLELESYLEELQAGHVTHPPSELTCGHADIYRMLMLIRTASPEGDEPRTEFAVALQMRLEKELQKKTVKPELL